MTHSEGVELGHLSIYRQNVFISASGFRGPKLSFFIFEFRTISVCLLTAASYSLHSPQQVVARSDSNEAISKRDCYVLWAHNDTFLCFQMQPISCSLECGSSSLGFTKVKNQETNHIEMRVFNITPYFFSVFVDSTLTIFVNFDHALCSRS